jgi:hypothetical protein
MKRNKMKTRPAKRRQSIIASIPPQPRIDGEIAPPMAANGLLRWLVVAALVAVSVGAAIKLAGKWEDDLAPTSKAKAESKRWKPEPWTPRTAEEHVIDRFFSLRQAGDKSALDLLREAPVFDDVPVKKETADRRQTDFFLRSDLRFRDVWRGEPDGNGGQKAMPGRYTIVTKGNASSPNLRIRTESGVEPPSQLMMANPDLVVEVHDGKICGVRAELHLGP